MPYPFQLYFESIGFYARRPEEIFDLTQYVLQIITFQSLDANTLSLGTVLKNQIFCSSHLENLIFEDRPHGNIMEDMGVKI
jgi:hypothetical protein